MRLWSVLLLLLHHVNGSGADQCSCDNVIAAGEAALAASTIVGTSGTAFNSQFTFTADVRIDDLTPLDAYKRSIVEITTDNVDLYDFVVYDGPMDCPGDDIATIQNVMSMTDCINECRNQDGCNAVTWVGQIGLFDNSCWLKNNNCLNALSTGNAVAYPSLRSAYSISSQDDANGVGAGVTRCMSGMPGFFVSRTLHVDSRGPISLINCLGKTPQWNQDHFDPGLVEGQWAHWEFGHRYDDADGEYKWHWAVNDKIVYEKVNPRTPFVFHGEPEIGTVTVSGEHNTGLYLLEYMFDGNSNTFWHSHTTNSWTNIEFISTHTVTEIVMERRHNCCTDRYGGVKFQLFSASGTLLSELVTTSSQGAPYLVAAENALRVPYAGEGIANVKRIRIEFPGNLGQIGELTVYGAMPELYFLGRTPKVWTGHHKDRFVGGAIKNVQYHTCGEARHLRQACIDHWEEWGGCSVTCGGGVKTRRGWFDGVEQTEQRPCNTNTCGFDPTTLPPCSCTNGNTWYCQSSDCASSSTCQRVALNANDMHCVPRNLGRCKAWGDPHIVTFDGAQNDVYGHAEYTLAQPSVTKEEMDGISWTIIMETRPYGRVAVATRFELQVSIEVSPSQTDTYKLVTNEHGEYSYEWDIDGVTTFAEFESYVKLRKSGSRITYETPIGLRVSHKRFNFQVDVPIAYYNGNIEGLCADFNFDKTNDFMEKDGTVHPFTDGRGYKQTDSEYETAKSWIITGDDGPHPGVIAESLNSCVHLTMCENMFNAAWMDNCRGVVDTSDLIASCKVDYCEVPNQETLESIYDSFINFCKAVLPDDNAICTWRTELGFDDCPADRVWNGCLAQCTAAASCDVDAECNDEIKEEGCFCSGGKVLFNDECIDVGECPVRTCGHAIQVDELRIHENHHKNKLLATVDYDLQYIHQVEIKFNTFNLLPQWQNIIYAQQPGSPDQTTVCGRRDSAIFITTQGVYEHTDPFFNSKKLFIDSCVDVELGESYPNRNDIVFNDGAARWFTEDQLVAAGFKVGEYQLWRFGQRRDALGGFEYFLELNGNQLVAYANSKPLHFGQMEVFAGKAKDSNNDWKTPDLYLRKYFFHSSPSFADINECLAGSWGEWSECSVTCGGGVKTRSGLINGAMEEESRPCNTEVCPFDPAATFPACDACSDGSWLCTDNACPARHYCQRVSFDHENFHCLPQSYGRCYAWGDPHVVTFDGAQNDVYGVAKYTFSQVDQDAIGDKIDFNWQIIMETRQWGRVAVATNFKLIVTGANYGYVVNTDEHGNYDYSFNFPVNHEVQSYADFKRYLQLSKHGRMVTFLTPFGLRFTNNGFLGDLRLPFAFAYGVEGLCGDYGLDKTNDYQCPDGTVHPFVGGGGYARSTSEWETAKCWKVTGDDGPDPGQIAEQHALCPHRPLCDALFSDDWMSNCVNQVDIGPFIKNCYTDYCEVPTVETLKDIYGAFFSACKNKLPEDDAVCTWKDRLGYVDCQGGLVWSGCRPQCEALASCDPELMCDNSIIEEGCFCPTGTVNYHGMCTDPSTCPDLICGHELQRTGVKVDHDVLLGTVDLPEQYAFQFDVMFTHALTYEDKHQAIFKAVRHDVSRVAKCGHREPILFVHKNTEATDLYYGSRFGYFYCAEGQSFNDNLNVQDDPNQPAAYRFHDYELPANWVNKVTPTKWTRMRMGRLRNRLTGQLENFWQWDGETITAIANNDPAVLPGMEIYAGTSPIDATMPYFQFANARLRKVVFASGESYHNVQGCFDDIWSEWTSCSASCGGGTKSRSGRIENVPMNEEVACNTHLCPDFDPTTFPVCSCPPDQWRCTATCANRSSCQRIALESDAMHCLPDKIGMCYAYGDPHIYTFDGIRHDIYGVANYTFAQFNTDDFSTDDNLQWTMVMETAPIGVVSYATSWTLTVSTDNFSYTIRTDDEGKYEFQFSFSNDYITMRSQFEKYIQFSQHGVTTSYQTPFGLYMKVKGKRANLRLPYAFAQKTEAVCGNFNFDRSDDFMCPDGTIHSAEGSLKGASPSEFATAQCWMVGDDPVDNGPVGPPPGTDDCDRSKCYALFYNELFDNCKGVVDITPFIHDCLDDYCIDPSDETLAEVYLSFVDACREVLPDDPIICTWKSAVGLVQCPTGQDWDGCRAQCSAWASCDNPFECDTNATEEGCFCPEGQIAYGDQCIEPDACPSRQCHQMIHESSESITWNVDMGMLNLDLQFIVQAEVTLTNTALHAIKWKNIFQVEADNDNDLACHHRAPAVYLVPQTVYDDAGHVGHQKHFYIYMCSNQNADGPNNAHDASAAQFYFSLDEMTGFTVGEAQTWRIGQKVNRDTGEYEIFIQINDNTIRTFTNKMPLKHDDMHFWLGRRLAGRDDSNKYHFASGSVGRVLVHTAPPHEDIDYCLGDNWMAWSECTVTCGGGVKSRSGWANDAVISEDSVCNTNKCPFDVVNEPPCTCPVGQWTCQGTCPVGQKCQRVDLNTETMRCLEMDVGKCGIYGDPHIYTYDGAKNDVYGVANYTVSQFNDSHTAPMDLTWSISMETEPVNHVSRAKSFTLSVSSSLFTYEIKTTKDPGMEISYSYTFNDGSITTDAQFEFYIQLNKRFSNQITYVVPFGVEISHKGSRGEIFVSYAYKGLLEGICGNYDFDKEDDFKCPDGTVWPFHGGTEYARTTSEWETAKCWKEDGDDGPDPNDVHNPDTPDHGPDNQCPIEHNIVCYNMFLDDIFDACRAVIDITPFINACLVDYCQVPTPATLEEIYSVFMDQCNNIVPENPASCDWKNQLDGFDDCPVGTVWSGCKPQCEAFASCSGNAVCNDNILLEGCFCADGTLLNDDNECIVPEDCADTTCGDTIDWNYGPNWPSVNTDCVDDVCTLSCADSLFPYPMDEITCIAKVLFPVQGIPVTCEQTNCGSLDQFGFDSDSMTADCEKHGCTIQCNDQAKRPTVKFIACNEKTRQFDDNNFQLECVDNTDTPCGNLADFNINIGAEVTAVCESFNSMLDNEPVDCTFSCPVDTVLVGPEWVVCQKDGTYSESNVEVKCCAEQCCSISDHTEWNVLSQIMEIATSEADKKVMRCKNDDQIIVDKITKSSVNPVVLCDVINHEWSLDHLLNVECRTLACDVIFDEVNSVDLVHGAALDCTSGECSVSCSNSDFPIPEVDHIDCDNVAAVIASGKLSCYETSCGNIDDFNFGPNWSDVDVNCDDHGDCDLSCPTGYVFPVSRVRCLNGQLIPLPDDGLEISCTETECGTLAHDASLTSTCDQFGCSLECVDASKVPNMKEVLCAETGERFDMDHQLACIDDRDTPCGDVPLTLHESVIKTCDEWTSIFDSTCHSCRFTCEHAAQRIHGVDRVQCSDGQFDVAAGHVYCLYEQDDTVCGDLDTFISIDNEIDMTCSETECTASCKDGKPTVANIECDIETGIYTIQQDFSLFCENPDECGLLEDTLTLPVDVTYSCSYKDFATNFDSRCTIQCPSGSLPSPIAHVDCDADAQQWSMENIAIECHDTKCGDSSTWDFGDNFGDIEKYCHYDELSDVTTCQLHCQSSLTGKTALVIDQNGNEISTVTCDDESTLLPASGTLELTCAETMCGSISQVAQVSAEVITLCSETQCSFTCPDDDKMATYSRIICDTTDATYNADNVVIECVDIVDTPCGNVADAFEIDPSISVSCETFESVQQNEQVQCHATCKNPAHFIDNSEIICVNGAFVNSGRNMTCMPTPCGDPADFVAIEDNINVSCDNDTCTFECVDSLQISLVRELVCNVDTRQFEEIVLWPDLSPFNVTHIVCDVPKQTYCDDPIQYFVNTDLTTAYFDCNWQSGTCLVKCYDTNHTPTINQVTCNAATEKFHQSHETDIKCVEYETECGNLVDHFSFDPTVSWLCDDDDVCTFSCPAGHTASTGSVSCENNHFLIDNVVVNQNTLTITCEVEPETQCGRLIDSFTIDPSVIISCTYHSGRCDFSCSDETHYLALDTVICDPVNGYLPSTGVIECSGDYDTSCGDLPGDILVKSVKTCADNVCTFECSDNQHVKGIISAECDPVSRIWSYSYYLPSAVESVKYSTCTETMCGDIENINIDTNSVTIDTQNIDGQGYGNLVLECQDPSLVLTGSGNANINCPENTGVWEVEIDAVIKCSTTVCGDPDDVYILDPRSSWNCVDNICTFSCNDGDASLETLICNESTGHWITGPELEVKCESGCAEFGTIESGYTVDNDLIVKCSENARRGTTQCDLICREGVPTINDTDVTINQVICNEHYNDAKWMKLDHDMFGIPHQVIVQTGHIHCDTDPKPDVEDEKCINIDDAYSMTKEVIVKCSHDMCAFDCPSDRVLSTETTHVYCLDGPDGNKDWFPKVDEEIKCVKKDEDCDNCNMCSDIRDTVNIDHNVVYECSHDKCIFDCKFESEHINIEDNIGPDFEK